MNKYFFICILILFPFFNYTFADLKVEEWKQQNTFTKYGQILNYKVYCERMLSMIANDMYPTFTYNQKQQLLYFFHHQKEECDNALQRLDQDALKDKLISKLAERRANNINWR